MVSWHSRPLSILSSLGTVRPILSDTAVLHMEMAHAAESNAVDNDEEEEKLYLWRLSRQIEIPPLTQSAVIVRCKGEELLVVETTSISPKDDVC